MGMFDWYIPVPDLKCPNCNLPLKDWQGKDAICALFIWKQGFAFPVEQGADDCNIDVDERKKFRLPKTFVIYNYCENCKDYRIEATCKTEDEIWVEITEIKLEKLEKLRRKWFDRE